MNEAARRLRAMGVPRVSVLAESANPRAVAFWDARADMGYERDPGIPRYGHML